VFKQRVVTGMILALAVFGAIAFVNSELLAVLVLIMLLVGGWEWANLVGIQNNAARAGYLILTAAACAAVVWFAPLNLVAIYAGTAWWTFVVVLLSFIRHVPHGASPLHYLLKAAGPPVLAVLLASIYWIHQQGWQWLFYLVLLTSLADTGAYLSGKTFGKRKLAPELSPAKSSGCPWATGYTWCCSRCSSWWFPSSVICSRACSSGPRGPRTVAISYPGTEASWTGSTA
jgi:phosphatidate cytidylyltransferase